MREYLIQEYLDIGRSYYFEGAEEEWVLEEAGPWADKIIERFNKEKR